MDEYEKYLFDLCGYIVVRNAITAAQIDNLSTRLEMHRTEKSYLIGAGLSRFHTKENLAWTASSLLDWGGCYIDLLDLPTIRPYLETLLGRNYRLDHDYIKIDNAKHSYELYLYSTLLEVAFLRVKKWSVSFVCGRREFRLPTVAIRRSLLQTLRCTIAQN